MTGEKRPFAVFDFDGTLIRWQLYHSIVDHLAHNGYVEPALYQTVRENRLHWKRRKQDFKSYEKVLVQTYEQTLKNLTSEQFRQAVEETFEEHKEQVYTYTRDLVRSLKAQEYTLLAISGSQIEAVERIAKHYGFDDWAGTTYHQKAGRFTGSKTFAAQDKKRTLQKLIDKHNLTLAGSIAVGDSESDISMLDMAEHPIAFNPTQGLFDHAKNNSWEVVIERKNVVYRLKPKDNKYNLI